MTTVTAFIGPYAFLSNFFKHPVHLDGVEYPSVEHAYQAAKTLDPKLREPMQLVFSCAKAKLFGQYLPLRPDWETVKDRVMLSLLREKFSDEGLADQLLATDNVELVEGNNWGDRYWGVCCGEGLNKLGLLLMLVRHELKVSTND
jgi:N-glycosidase YbiA